jgi:hypothetical protein
MACVLLSTTRGKRLSLYPDGCPLLVHTVDARLFCLPHVPPRGSVIVIVVPWPTVLCTAIWPPCAATTSCTR